jgi:hypothetical protein
VASHKIADKNSKRTSIRCDVLLRVLGKCIY